MTEERRREARHVVDGLRAELDGIAHEILDISASGIRLVRTTTTPATARLRLVSEEACASLDVAMEATFQRASSFAVVYRYRCPLADWPARLARFDVFADLGLPILEDRDGA
jgi:hypothetical protein